MRKEDQPTETSPSADQGMTRADFLTATGKSVVLLMAGAAGYASWNSLTSRLAQRKLTPIRGYPSSPWYSMAVDITACIGCGKCVDACCAENDVPAEHFRTWVERYIVKKDGEVVIDSPNGGKDGFTDTVPEDQISKAFFMPKLCNHCDESPCIQVCPVGATFLSPEGVVLIDYEYCIGCGYCIQACPYGSRFWNPNKHTADKCTLCYHRITKGQLPACVEVCPVKARIFGNLADPDSPISKFCRENPVMTLKPQLRTGAKVVYKGLSKEVV
ncbi:MAG: 4Fe-4S dicluster domain-containing protein [Fimbriimonas sp.]|nr:4Fe-4S dicluster domain-containing protein [Fimbriimonas sp.]